MKKKTYRISRMRRLLRLTWIVSLPVLMYGQNGINDSTFNIPDNGNNSVFKGTDNSVKFSVVQSNSRKVVIAGDFTSYNGSPASRIARLLSNGDPDPTFNMGTGLNGPVTGLIMLPDNKVMVTGNFNTYNNQAANRILRINTNGEKDNAFNIGAGFNGPLNCIALQVDGKILVGGNFTQYNNATANGLVRLNKNGTPDPAFILTNSYTGITKIAVQTDGKIIVGYRDASLKRLNTDGSEDGTFSGSSIFLGEFPILEALTLQPNGKIIIGGVSLEGINGVNGFLQRLNPDGLKDTTFQFPYLYRYWIHAVTMSVNQKIWVGGSINVNPDDHIQTNFIALLDPDGSINPDFMNVNKSREVKNVVYTISTQSDGKMYAGGYFNNLNTYSVNNFTRLELNGTQDISFNITTGANGTVKTIAVQPDGKALIGGNFSAYQYISRNRIARLLKNGRLDTGFAPSQGANGPVNAIAIQADGKILIGGSFTSFDNKPGSYLVRLNPNGQYDNTFHALDKWDTNAEVNDILVQPDGKIIVGGYFKKVDGLPYKSLVRLNADGTVDSSFQPIFPYSIVHKLGLLPSGQVLAAGNIFYIQNGNYYTEMLRVNTDGSIDTTFDKPYDSEIFTFAVQPDGKIITGSGREDVQFSYVGYIRRYYADGPTDSTFAQGATNYADHLMSIRTLSVLPNGEILAGGCFSKFNDASANNVVLLNANGTVDVQFTGDANAPVYASKTLTGDKALLGGAFNRYNGMARNGITRILFFFGRHVKRSISDPIGTAPAPALAVYPNPGSNRVIIDGLEPGNGLIITDVNGRIVHKEIAENTTRTLDISDYPNGMYLISRINGQKIKVEKLVVSK